jgi:hypothetical protein
VGLHSMILHEYNFDLLRPSVISDSAENLREMYNNFSQKRIIVPKILRDIKYKSINFI